mgnify:CR=1 FL=1
MPKIGMQPVRKRQLIDATIATIHEHSFAEATIARIARRAGLSPGIIAHYFGGKDALLAATMRHLLTELLRDATERLKRARSPMERVDAVVSANFGPSQFTNEVIAAWFAFWGQVPHSPELRRLNDVYMGRTRSNLAHALGMTIDREAADRIASVAACMIDGIWVRAALTESRPDGAAATAMVMAYIRDALAEKARVAVMARAEGRSRATETGTSTDEPPMTLAVY